MIQLYAPLFHDGASFTEVGRQVAWMLRRAHLPAQIYAIKTAFGDYSKQPLDVRLETGAKTGILVGYPGDASWLTGHEYKVLVTVCESAPVPRDWVTACNAVDLLVVPSKWCKTTFEESGVTRPILVCPHGAPGLLKLLPAPPRIGPEGPIILHVTAAMSFPQRKGTPAFFMACDRLWKQGWKFRVKLKVPQAPDAVLGALEDMGIRGRVDLAEGILKLEELYRNVHASCQPSRGEGFGCVPLETRMAGRVPILTATSGHSEHVQPCDVIVESGRPEQMATQGNAGGWAPTVSASQVETALARYLQQPEWWVKKVSEWRMGLDTMDWSWEKGLLPLQAALQKLDHGKTIGSGWVRGVSA